ncbi:MAG: hypothetical protein KGZ89_08135 [Actinobacteria bacterium]|nr:hypothetical protein [Actinomycetota bacterium]
MFLLILCVTPESTHKQTASLSVEDEARLTLTAKGRYLLVARVRQFFVSVNSVRDQARESLPAEERKCPFSTIAGSTTSVECFCVAPHLRLTRF